MQHSQGFLHTVQKGDTLYRLSRRYHVPLWAILYANPYINIYNLQIGDEVCIPARVYPKEGTLPRCSREFLQMLRERVRTISKKGI